MTAQSQIYKYKDKDGNTVFSDTKPPDAQPEGVEQVELKATNSAAPTATTQRPPAPKTPSAQAKKYSDRIISPASGSTIPMGPGNFSVTANLIPPLSSGERVQLLVDGAPMGEPQRGGSWQLSNVFRGEHTLIVQRTNSSGDVLHTSEPTIVYVLRPSIR